MADAEHEIERLKELASELREILSFLVLCVENEGTNAVNGLLKRGWLAAAHSFLDVPFDDLVQKWVSDEDEAG